MCGFGYVTEIIDAAEEIGVLQNNRGGIVIQFGQYLFSIDKTRLAMGQDVFYFGEVSRIGFNHNAVNRIDAVIYDYLVSARDAESRPSSPRTSRCRRHRLRRWHCKGLNS